MKPLDLVDLLMKKLGYVRLKAHGYALTPEGRIVEVRTVDDDRFEPPPMSVVPFQSAAAMLPPAPKVSFPVPRPLPPPPVEAGAEATPVPLFTITKALEPVAPVAAEATDIDMDEEIDEEEWQWKMAMARARAIAADLSAAPAPAPVGNEPTQPRPTQRPAVASSPISAGEMPRRPARSAPRPSDPPSQRAAVAPARAGRNPPRASDPPPRVSSVLQPREPGKTLARTGLEKSVARAFTSGPEPKRPLPERPAATRVARGTQPPQRAMAAPHTVARAAEGTPPPRGKRPVGEDTATDITAVDRARMSMRHDEDTRVNMVSAPAIAAHLDDDLSIDEERPTFAGIPMDLSTIEETFVDPPVQAAPAQVAAVVAAKSDAPLPRLSARLKRPTA